MLNKRAFYINGSWVEPEISNDFSVVDPSTEENCAVISLGSQADTDKAVKAARDAFESWMFTPKNDRLELIENILEEYKLRAEDMAKAISLEMGAPIEMARQQQVGTGLNHIKVFINVLDIPELWKKSLLEKFWNEDEFKILLDEISKKNINNDKFAERVYSLDIESALELVRGTINSSDGSFFAGRSLEEITDRLRKKGESYSLKPLSDSTKKLITEFLSIKDTPSLAISGLRKLCKSLDRSLLNKIDEVEKRFEIINSNGVDFNNAIFGAEKGRDVEYYSGFLYDFAWSNNNESIYIGGGGRYDDLIRLLGSENRIPAVGAALNLKKVERISQIESL